MSPDFWEKLHGASTHFPIALLIAATVFDFTAFCLPVPARWGLHSAGYFAMAFGALGSVPAVISGLLITNWDATGHGELLKHHLFVWPAWGLLVGLAVWRVVAGTAAPRTVFAVYLAFAFVAVGLMAAAGYWGGELRFHS